MPQYLGHGTMYKLETPEARGRGAKGRSGNKRNAFVKGAILKSHTVVFMSLLTSPLPSTTHLGYPMIPSKPCLRQGSSSSSSHKKSNVSKKKQNAASVAFGDIEVAEYPMQLGDHPVAEGVPVSIGWTCERKQVFDLDEYESYSQWNGRRTRFQLVIPPKSRREIVTQQGSTANEVRMAMMDAKKIKRSRNRSIKNQRWDRLHLIVEKGHRKLKKVTSLTRLNPRSSSSVRAKEAGTPSFSKSLSSESLCSSEGDDNYCYDPSDVELRQSRLAMHLLRHPEELEDTVEEEEEDAFLHSCSDDEGELYYEMVR
eukprot:scaffold6966_cov112-Cylindrotheca_fusiformis.AAC.18